MKRLIAGTAVGLAALGSLGIAGTAFAAQPNPNGPVSATVSVPSATTITLSETSIPQFNVTPGQPDTDTSLIVNVGTNAPGAGQLVAELPDGHVSGTETMEDFLNGGGTGGLPDSDWSINSQQFTGGVGGGVNNPTETVDTWANPTAAGDFPQTVTVTTAASQAPDTYAGTISYTAVG